MKVEARLEQLERQMRTQSALSVKRWLHAFTDLELATLTTTVSDLDAEIFMLLLVCSEAEIRAIAGQLGHEK